MSAESLQIKQKILKVSRLIRFPFLKCICRAALGRVCLKLVIVMGVTWVADLLSWAVGGPHYMWYVTDIINALQGVLIFIVVACQPQVSFFFKYSLDRDNVEITLIKQLKFKIYPLPGLDSTQEILELKNGSPSHKHNQWSPTLQLITRTTIDGRLSNKSHNRLENQNGNRLLKYCSKILRTT